MVKAKPKFRICELYLTNQPINSEDESLASFGLLSQVVSSLANQRHPILAYLKVLLRLSKLMDLAVYLLND